jgi:hypothetical protein
MLYIAYGVTWNLWGQRGVTWNLWGQRTGAAPVSDTIGASQSFVMNCAGMVQDKAQTLPHPPLSYFA